MNKLRSTISKYLACLKKQGTILFLIFFIMFFLFGIIDLKITLLKLIVISSAAALMFTLFSCMLNSVNTAFNNEMIQGFIDNYEKDPLFKKYNFERQDESVSFTLKNVYIIIHPEFDGKWSLNIDLDLSDRQELLHPWNLRRALKRIRYEVSDDVIRIKKWKPMIWSYKLKHLIPRLEKLIKKLESTKE